MKDIKQIVKVEPDELYFILESMEIAAGRFEPENIVHIEVKKGIEILEKLLVELSD